MSTIVLCPRLRKTAYTVLNENRQEIKRGTFDNETDSDRIEAALRPIGETARKPRVLGLRIPYGGKRFSQTILARAGDLTTLSSLSPESPLHLPYCLALAKTCNRIWPDLPLALCFDTAFFAGLPPREQAYALDSSLLGSRNLRRFGYHGLYHEAAVQHVNRIRREGQTECAGRIISLCLEPKPELAAVTGTKPVMVTSGATPLEGLPGEVASGELDPAILLDLMEKKGMGPEQINALLTRESGLFGLTGAKAGLGTVLTGSDPSLRPARDILIYRIKLACGAAVAAMSGADRMVFSGRYASAGAALMPEIHTMFAGRIDLKFDIFDTPIEHIVADQAAAAMAAGL